MRAIKAQTDGASAAGHVDDARRARGFSQEGREVISHQLRANRVCGKAGHHLLRRCAIGTRNTGIVDQSIESNETFSDA